MIDAALLRQLKKKAAAEGRTLQDLVNDLLQQALHTASRSRFSLQLHGWQAKEHLGVDLVDRDKLFDLMHGR